MNNKVSELKRKMADNEELLAQISTDKQKEQQRLVSEKAAAEAQKNVRQKLPKQKQRRNKQLPTNKRKQMRRLN